MNSGSVERDNLYQIAKSTPVKTTVLSTIISVDSSKWELCLSAPQSARQLREVLEQFDGTAYSDNLFFQVEFLAAAFRRMNNTDTLLLGVWETIGIKRNLQMYLPIVVEVAGFAGKRIWRSWSHDYAPLGTPIVNKNDSNEILEKLSQLLQKVEHPNSPALVISDLPMENEIATRLQVIATHNNYPLSKLPLTSRAMISGSATSHAPEGLIDKAKKLRQFRRQQRRLGELGQFELERVDSYSDVILRFEEFLLLESRGWKGRKGTSIHTLKRTAAFARQSVTDLAKSGNAAIYSLRLNGNAIASLIVLNYDGSFYPWKIAYDQEFSLYSPGALLMLRVSQMLGARSDFVKADSLAGINNMLVNGIWKKRLSLGSLILPVGKTSQNTLDSIAAAIKFKHEFKRKAKQYLNK